MSYRCHKNIPFSIRPQDKEIRKQDRVFSWSTTSAFKKKPQNSELFVTLVSKKKCDGKTCFRSCWGPGWADGICAYKFNTPTPGQNFWRASTNWPKIFVSASCFESRWGKEMWVVLLALIQSIRYLWCSHLKNFLVCSDHPSGLLNQERVRQEGTSLSFQLTGVFEESPYSQDSFVSFDLKIH